MTRHSSQKPWIKASWHAVKKRLPESKEVSAVNARGRRRANATLWAVSKLNRYPLKGCYPCWPVILWCIGLVCCTLDEYVARLITKVLLWRKESEQVMKHRLVCISPTSPLLLLLFLSPRPSSSTALLTKTHIGAAAAGGFPLTRVTAREKVRDGPSLFFCFSAALLMLLLLL